MNEHDVKIILQYLILVINSKKMNIRLNVI